MPEPALDAIPTALVGCGQISRAYVAALARTETLTLVAVVDPDAEARARLAAELEVAAFESVPALLATGPALRAALLLTPPDTHEPLARHLLEHGVHVLCEKPLAPTPAAAERMLAAARSADRRLMMGSKFRYSTDVLAARRLLDAGFCGDIVLYENVFCSHVDMTRRWNAVRARSGGGVLIDNGCHSVDVARFLLGPIARVQAWFGRVAQAIAVEDTARLLFESQSGALGSIDLSWSVHKATPAYVRIHGTAGTIEIGWQESRCQRVGDAEWRVFGHGYDKVAAFAAQLDDFAAVVRGERAGIIGDDDALASVTVIERAYESQRAERWLAIAP
ncbi:MAG: Gfo/Idh/MocA family oxidoreductase [Planctomycetes bacterium]|nr:Gfo/Idh/MocA family oxidoreductase [Planctomycetota bacterium]